MNSFTLMFLILRKNVNQLRMYVHNGSSRNLRRRHIIDIKYQLAKLSKPKYNLIKTISTDVNRFIIKNVVKDFVIENDENIIKYVIQDTDIVLRHEYNTLYNTLYNTHEMSERGQAISKDPWVIYDKIYNIHFLIFDEHTMVDNIILFEHDEHLWFIEVYKTLNEMKIAEDNIIKQQKLMEEEQRIANKKKSILSKY